MNKERKRIVFLDIDGVLVHSECEKNITNSSIWIFDPKCVECLNEFTDKTDSEIVLSSFWRVRTHLSTLRKMFNESGIKAKLIGKTPEFKETEGKLVLALKRGDEILEWIELTKDNLVVEDYIVIDDNIHDIEGIIEDDRIIHVEKGWERGGLKPQHLGDFTFLDK